MRTILNLIPFVAAVGLLSAMLALVVLAWVYAWANGWLPPPDHDYSRGGPWNQHPEMTQFVDFISGVGALAALASIVWFCTTKASRERAMAVGGVLVSIVVVGYHVLMID